MSPRERRPAVVVTCEHGGNRVPRRYTRLFAPHESLLQSHRGWDPGSLDLARAFARAFDTRLIASTTTRLLVELNRSPHHRSLFSAITRSLPREEREAILARWYTPHREHVVEAIENSLAHADSVIHLAIHTFTPALDGAIRSTDVGLLFDPARSLERNFCVRWQRELQLAMPRSTIHRNQPYRGVSDGLATALRRSWRPSRYAGIELEVNQRFVDSPPTRWRQLLATLTSTCRAAVLSLAAEPTKRCR